MSLEQALQFVPVFVLVFFRITGIMIFAPLLGSEKIPKRIRILIALVLAAGMCGSVHQPPHMPQTTWGLTLGIAGEIIFGIAMGMGASFTFIAVQWAGEMIGQQMGFNLSEVLDPQFGGASSIVGDLYFMLTLSIYLLIGAHRELIRGIRMSFESLPLLSVGIDRSLFDVVIGLFQSCTTLAVQLAAPVLVTMLVTDLALGCISKAMPQMNFMTAGVSVRTLLGLAVLIVGLVLTVNVLTGELNEAMNFFKFHMIKP